MFNQIAANFKLGKGVKSSPKVQKSIRNYTTNSHFPQRTNFSHLSNGLGVATETIPGETATIGVYINTGSAQETHQNNGVSNFLSQVALKGTKNRSESQLRQEIENIGGQLSVHACKERTGYVAKVQKQDVPKAVNILSDIIQNSLYRNDSIEETRNVVLHDKEKYENDEVGSLFSHLYSLAFQGTSLALPVHGTTENIQNFQRDDIINYLNSNYTADRMVVVGTGAVEHNQISSLVEEQFTTIPRSHDHFRPPIAHYTGSGVEVLDDTEPFVRGILAFRAVDHTDANLIPLQIIRKIIGDYDKNYAGGNRVSSKLGELLATEQVGEYMTTFLDTFSSIGLFGVHFKVAADISDEFCKFFTYELNQIALGASEKEVDLAKNKLKADLLFATKGIRCLNKSIGKQYLTIGRRVTNEELFARIDAVDVNVIRNVARQYLTDVDPITVAVGDLLEYPDYNQLRSWTYWNRH